MIVAPQGMGGMGEVYRARDTRLGREVALKVLPDRLQRDPEAMARFQREARAASALNHPHIVTVYDVGIDDQIPYYTMELIDGTTLREHLSDPHPKLLGYFIQVADALAKTHAAGILHRDLKPENVMVTADGYAKVVDFGLAKFSELQPVDTKSPTALAASVAGSIGGTVSYMSPEQVEGRPLDGRSDTFSFGAMLYEALAGRRPFDAPTAVDTMHAIVHQPHPRMERRISDRLRHLVDRCLAKSPEDRYQSIKEAAIELRSVLRDLEGGARRRVPRRVVVIGLIAIVAAGAVGYSVYRKAAAKEKGRPHSKVQSLAVLPFENRAASADSEYISDGITEEIINSLSQLPNLRVLARSTVVHYKGKATGPHAAGKELGVDAVVFGQLRQLQDRITVNVELARTADGVQLWGQQYNRKAADLLNVSGEIARDVTQRLQERLGGAAVPAARKQTDNPRAYEAYLKGRYFWNQRPAGLQKSLEFFEEAREIDPGYALAHAGVAMAYDAMGQWETGRLNPNVAFARAKVAAQQALALDPELAEGYAALGFAQFNYDRDFSRAEENLIKAARLKPSDGTPHHWLSHLHIAQGRNEDSLRESLQALQLEPLDPVLMAHLGWHYVYTRQPDRVLEQADKALAVYPDNFFLICFGGLAYEQKGMLPEAIAAFQKARRLVPTSSFGTAGLAHALALAGRRAEAQALLRELEGTSGHVAPFDFAIIHLGLGQREKAFDALERTVNENSPWAIYLRAEPRLDPIRNDPRFIATLKRLQ